MTILFTSISSLLDSILAYKSSLKDSISMVWCGISFLPGNRVSEARFINQKSLKKILSLSLSYKPKYPKKI